MSPLLFNFEFEHTFRRVQVNKDGFELNGIHQLLVYAGGVNILRGSVHTVKVKAEVLVVTSKEIRLEVLIKLSTWSCLETKLQYEVTI